MSLYVYTYWWSEKCLEILLADHFFTLYAQFWHHDRVVNSVSLSPVGNHERSVPIAFSQLDLDVDKFLAIPFLWATRILLLSITVLASNLNPSWFLGILNWRIRCGTENVGRRMVPCTAS